MSFLFDLDSTRRTAYFTGQGSCDYVDFCVALNGLLNHPLYQPGMSIVWDWQRCEILLANTQIRSVIETMTRFTPSEQSHKVAIITSMTTHDQAVTFQKYVEAMTPQWRVMLFNSMEQTTSWMFGSDSDDFPTNGKSSKSLPPGTTAFFKPQTPRTGLWTSF